jgi:hypothetical protein
VTDPKGLMLVHERLLRGKVDQHVDGSKGEEQESPGWSHSEDDYYINTAKVNVSLGRNFSVKQRNVVCSTLEKVIREKQGSTEFSFRYDGVS